MLKLVLNDYWMELKKLSKRRKWFEWLTDGWMVFYLSTILPDLIFEGLLAEGRQGVWGIAFWVIMWIGIGLCRLYPNHLEEIFYLHPVPQKDRRAYLLTGYWFRVFLFSVVLGGYLLAWAVAERIPLFRAGYLLLHYFLVLCLVNTDISDMINQVMGNRNGWRIYLSCAFGFISIVLIYRASPAAAAAWRPNWAEEALTIVEPFFAAGIVFSYWHTGHFV